MSSKRKIWIALLGTVVILALMAGGVVAGWLIYQKKRNDGWLRDALVAYESQQWERAKGLFERYIPQEPKNEELLLKYADTCKRMQKDRAGSLQGAATAYVQILTHYPDNDKVRHELIDVYAKLGVWSTLRYYTAEWLIRDPNDQYVRYYHALALDRMGLRDEAIAAYESLVNEKTDRSDVYGSYARLLREKGLESRAMEVFIKAREERPNDGHIVVDQARFLARTSTWTEVQHLLDEGLAMSPEDSDVLVAVAQAAMLRRQHAHAVELLRKAVKIKPDEGPAYLMLSSALSYQGLLEEAIKELKQVDPLVQVDTPMMLITLADLQLGIAAFDDAKLTIAQYNEAYPDQLPINEYFAAKELLVRGEPSAAVKRLASVIELRPGFTPAQYTLAEAYLATGEPELARNALESYLAKNTADERAQRLMAQRFGRPASIESIAARTEDMLQTKEADPQRMTLLAAALLDTAVRSDAVDQHASLIERTLRRVLESAPDSVDAYRILADLALWRKNPDAAEKVIADALENGVAESEFAMLRAAVALVRNDVTTFESLLANAKANKTLDRALYAVWAGFFAQHGFYDNAIALLEQGIAGLEKGEARASLEVERAIMALRHGETDKSAAWLTESDGSVATGTTLRRRFNAARLLLAQTYLISTDSQEMEQEANRLVNAVRTEDPGNAMLQVVDGLMLMRKRPPALEEAEVLFERAVAADSGNLGAQWGLARVALARSDFPRALMYIERALGLAPQM
ncbi:MAG TPA: tetratricopeptide repeat protein, partial [Candidatus Hydrogenedentes bacterium]|nr:tetratricopeptide repeat protein [Candidatus Hydrogenedentota bacterium]